MSEHDPDLEDRLKRGLRRVEAPEGFADRITDRIEAQRSEQRKGRLTVMPRRWISLAVAAMLLVSIVLGGWQWRQQQPRRQREQAEAARRQFEVAMQVTGRTLVAVQERIGRAGEIHSTGRKREVEQ